MFGAWRTRAKAHTWGGFRTEGDKCGHWAVGESKAIAEFAKIVNILDTLDNNRVMDSIRCT